ncbi:YdcF family protein [Synechococcus sp. RSCCF101]|uniref:YdcF family protein n=1 Tax=Synechococcus sp. RSCCF101 TaxID=2511069 RepID=UPI001248C8FC|nr:YdcF family protein [Synechococcus sp. RSCCF101]QEY32015.1 YdcF family protein [Synechococcus sp. RSCCF101]
MTYWLSKVLPLLVLPLGLVLWLLLAGWISGRRWPVLLALVLLWISSTPIVAQGLWRWLEKPWLRRQADAAPRAEAIVVLSGGRHPAPGSARLKEWHDPDRFLAGLNLWRAGRAPRLIFTGGVSPFQPGMPSEGSLYREEATDLGIPSGAIAVTGAVLNTADEARAVARLVPGAGDDAPRILLVTSAFHMRRAQRLFERQGLAVEPFPVDFQARGLWAGSLWRDPLVWIPSARGLDGTSRALRELMGRLVHRTW